jgi:flagellar hook-associated protein 1 FlgK
LAAIQPATATSAEIANGIALKLANLESSQDPADTIDNLSYTSFYGNLAAQVGTAVSTAQSNKTTQQDVVTQARDLRQQTSGVSLDEEAINVLELQRSYEAAAKMVSVLNELTQAVVGLIT